MTYLDKKFFGGGGDLPTDFCEKLLVENYHNKVSEALQNLGWEGQLISSVGLALSPDGSLVQSSRFLMRGGLLNEPIPIKVSAIWDGGAKDAFLNITLPDSSEFQFSGGELCSDFLPMSKVKFVITREGRPVLLTEWDTQKVGKFCLRLIVHLDKSSNDRSGPHFRVTVLLFPHSVEELAEMSEATQSVSWPGLRILEGRSELFPRPPPDFWGCPILPLLNTQSQAEDCCNIPTGDHLRFAIAELMRSAALPTVCKSRASLKKQTADMLGDPSSLDPREPAVTWPPTSRPAASTGKNTIKRRMYNT